MYFLLELKLEGKNEKVTRILSIKLLMQIIWQTHNKKDGEHTLLSELSIMANVPLVALICPSLK